MGFLNENITLAFFVYFGQPLSGLSLIVGFFNNIRIVIVLVGFSIAQGEQSSHEREYC